MAFLLTDTKKSAILKKMKTYPDFYKKHTAFIKDRKKAKKCLIILDKIATFALALLGATGGVLTLFGLFGAYLPTLFSLALPVALAFGIATMIRYAAPRERPYAQGTDVICDREKDSPSFPSRHTTCAFAIAVSLCATTLWLGVPALVLGACLAYIRFLCGYHYPADLIWGGIIGSGLGALAFLF